MSLALDPQTEQRIQQETLRGRYRDPSALINAALDNLAAEEPWSEEEKAELDAHLEQSEADSKAGRVYSADEAARLLDQRIAERALKRAS